MTLRNKLDPKRSNKPLYEMNNQSFEFKYVSAMARGTGKYENQKEHQNTSNRKKYENGKAIIAIGWDIDVRLFNL